jgi:hypothetical protein
MTTSQPDESPEELRAELERLDREIAELQRVAREMREQLADHSDGSEVGPDRTEALTMAEEQEAIAAVLQDRRDELQRRLAPS